MSQLPDLPLALSKSELIIAQQEDPELKGLFSRDGQNDSFPGTSSFSSVHYNDSFI